MVFSYYLYKYPYKIMWHVRNIITKNRLVAFYCADPLDYEIYKHIDKYLTGVKIIAKNSKTKKYLKARKINFKSMPSFPKAVIMGRQTPYKFPVHQIVKIGFDHGLYQFKRWTSAKNYNGFDIYFVSSERQVETAKNRGINTTYAVGYPKLDNAFNGEYDTEYLNKLRKKLNFDNSKKTLIFTTTWDVSGLSAINKWIDKIESLSNKYNILVSVHTWTKEKYKNKLRRSDNLHFIEEFDATPYLMIADILIGDYSSIIGEFCALDKPIITFKVQKSNRTIDEIFELIKSISMQVESFEELIPAIQECISYPNRKAEERKRANKILYKELDGKAGFRAAERIKTLLYHKKIIKFQKDISLENIL